MMSLSQIMKNPDLLCLHYALSKFTEAMWDKLEKKHKEGFRGWDSMPEEDLNKMLVDRALKQFDRGGGEEVDLANIAMFLWFRAIGGKEG